MNKSVQISELFLEPDYKLVTGDKKSLNRRIYVPEISRPGLELAGFFKHTDFRRVILFGEKEISFIDQMDPEFREAVFSNMINDETPCAIIAKGYPCPDQLMEIAKKRNFPIFTTTLPTGRVNVSITRELDERLAEETLMHGVFMSIYGKGVILRGSSGIGKSEIALELIKRGHSIVADDAIELYHVGHRIIGKAPKVLESVLEIRGVGVIDVSKMFGVSSVLEKDEVSMIIQLEKWIPSTEYIRIGVEEENLYENIMGVNIPKTVVPVNGGRSMAAIIETAVMNMQLKDLGYDSNKEFVNRILDNIKKKDDSLNDE